MRSILVAAAMILTTLAGCAGTPVEGSATSATAQPDVAPAEDVGDGTVCLRGVVVDPETIPVSGVEVVVVTNEARNFTGADGGFSICGLEPRVHTVLFERLGYESRAIKIEAPSEDTLVSMVPIRILAPYSHLTIHAVHYTIGLSTLDTATSRNLANATNCNPCTFSFWTPEVADFLTFELDWERTVAPVGPVTETMYHILRAGAPFEEGSDIGTGTMGKPFKFVYDKDTLDEAASLATDGLVPYSGSAFCWGSPLWPCVDQRIDGYMTAFFDYESIDDEYTAVPPS